MIALPKLSALQVLRKSQSLRQNLQGRLWKNLALQCHQLLHLRKQQRLQLMQMQQKQMQSARKKLRLQQLKKQIFLHLNLQQNPRPKYLPVRQTAQQRLLKHRLTL